MRFSWMPAGLAVLLGVLSAGREAAAQQVVTSAPVTVNYGPSVYTQGGGWMASPPLLPDGGVIRSYSYSISAPQPARGYVGYGDNDIFPYYGRPYGHAYDRYSWSAMSGENTMARYYYPPVR